MRPRAAAQSAAEASSAPSTSARSFSHAGAGSTCEKRMNVSKPQSVPAISRSEPMICLSPFDGRWARFYTTPAPEERGLTSRP